MILLIGQLFQLIKMVQNTVKSLLKYAKINTRQELQLEIIMIFPRNIVL